MYRNGDVNHQQQATIQKDFWLENGTGPRRVPVPLRDFYVGRERLDKALPKAKSLGVGEVIGRKCDIFLFEKVQIFGPRDQVFYLDQETSIPLQVDLFRAGEGGQRKQPESVWTAVSLTRVEGHPVVSKSKTAQFEQDGTLMFIWEHEVELIDFNKDYPAGTFWPALQPGVHVFDALTGKDYVTPPKQEEPAASDEVSATSIQPNRDDVQHDSTSIAQGRVGAWESRS